MAAVDATDCGIDGTVIWASREEGLALRAGTRPVSGSVDAFAGATTVLPDLPDFCGRAAFCAGADTVFAAAAGRLAWAGAPVFAAAREAGALARDSVAREAAGIAADFAPAAAGRADFSGPVVAVAVVLSVRAGLPIPLTAGLARDVLTAATAEAEAETEGARDRALAPPLSSGSAAATRGTAGGGSALPNPII